MPVLAAIVGVAIIGAFVAGSAAHQRTTAEKERLLGELAGQPVTLGVAAHDGRITFLVEADAIIAGVRDGQLLLSELIHLSRSGLTWPLRSDAEILRNGLPLHRVRWVKTADGHRRRW